jgi:hypothetical protein
MNRVNRYLQDVLIYYTSGIKPVSVANSLNLLPDFRNNLSTYETLQNFSAYLEPQHPSVLPAAGRHQGLTYGYGVKNLFHQFLWKSWKPRKSVVFLQNLFFEIWGGKSKTTQFSGLSTSCWPVFHSKFIFLFITLFFYFSKFKIKPIGFQRANKTGTDQFYRFFIKIS